MGLTPGRIDSQGLRLEGVLARRIRSGSRLVKVGSLHESRQETRELRWCDRYALKDRSRLVNAGFAVTEHMEHGLLG